MVLKLYGSAMAFSRVLVTILELDLPYEHVLVDISKGDQRNPEYKKLQPFGKVPVLEDDGLVMFESRAICRYLVNKYGKAEQTLLPKKDDFLAFGRFEQACSVEQSYFAAAAETIGTELIIKKMKGLGDPDPARVAQAEADLDETFAYYETILSKSTFLLGDNVTLADLYHLPNGAALKAFGWKDTFAKYPNVDIWFSKLQGLEIWTKAAQIAGTPP